MLFIMRLCYLSERHVTFDTISVYYMQSTQTYYYLGWSQALCIRILVDILYNVYNSEHDIMLLLWKTMVDEWKHTKKVVTKLWSICFSVKKFIQCLLLYTYHLLFFLLFILKIFFSITNIKCSSTYTLFSFSFLLQYKYNVFSLLRVLTIFFYYYTL